MASNQLLASKVVVTEEEPKLRGVPSLPTAICGAVGVTERGPVGLATLVTSMEEYTSTFGSHTANSDMAACVEAFFQNGGTQMYVVRTVHYSDVAAGTKTSAAATIMLVDRAGSPLSTLKIDGKYDGAYANGYKVKITAATSGEATRFDLQLLDANNVVLESFPNLSMVDADARYVETIINAEPAKGGSRLIKATDQDSVTVAPNDMPALVTSAGMASGDNGLTSLADTDFIGHATPKNGIRALDLVEQLTLLIVPGRATSAVHNAMITYCETTRQAQAFAVLDPPAAQSATAIITYVKTTAAIQNLTECAAIYWPRVKITNPKKSVYGLDDKVTVPPSGHIAGAIARTDNARPGGVYDVPAGMEQGRLFGVLDFETTECTDPDKLDLVFPERINPLTTFSGAPRFIDGARTLKGSGNFPTVAERRGVSFIERSIKAALQVFRHKNNTATLRAAIHRTVYNFMLAQMSFGAFASTNPDTAFSVDFGDALNPPAAKNTITGRVQVATAQPAEYIVLKFSQDTRAIEAAASGA
jgi:phage tail sheath protein FI